MKNVAFSSDFHIDITKEDIISPVKEYLKNNQVDIFCFAGDMSANIELSAKILTDIETDLGIKVLAVPGNHEMWDTTQQSSWDALLKFNHLLPTISVMENAYEFGDWVVLGNMNWYDYSTAHPIFYPKQLAKMQHRGQIWHDKTHCNWEGKSNPEVAEFFMKELIAQLEAHQGKRIILMSHVVPYMDCIKVIHDSSWDYFNAFIGNQHIGQLADKYQVEITHFGHTHTRHHKRSAAGVEMICSPLGYFGEWTSADRDIQEEIKKCIPILKL